ncbi:MAG: glycosyltransferase [Chthoniobacter sp.]|uniref:glycosyltransferase n=1 Tax=Chthoniobacter sp. TaxID=2510640 RepID=UPI0032A73E69
MKLLFVSNLFPDTAEPYRGLDNATLLHHLADRWDIRALAVRPSLLPRRWQPREQDAKFAPQYIATPYIPKIGSCWNHRIMAHTLRGHLQGIRQQFSFDVVLSSWIFPDSCAIAELARELDFPFIAIAQGSDVHQYLQMPARREIITRLLPRAAAVITRSGELARLLAHAGLPRERLHPIYNGVDLDLFRPADKAAARRELDLPPDAPLILFVGNFYEIKNPLLPPLALANLSSVSFPIPPVLVMVGGGGLEQRVRELAGRLPVRERVILPGRTDAAGVARYMQAADVLCLPSQNEGVPNVILEAFACGLPVIASRVGGIPEVHPGDDFGRLVATTEPAAFATAFQEVLLSPPSAERIRQHALQFSWQRTATACHELLMQARR